MKKAKCIFQFLAAMLTLLLFAACSATKFVPDDEYMLQSVKISSEPKGFDIAKLEPYVRQKPNAKWFSLVKIPLATYSLSGRDTTRWINRTLQRIGEAPVIYDSLQAANTLTDLSTAMRNMGFLHANAYLLTETHGKKLKAHYLLHPGMPYDIRTVKYNIEDEAVEVLLTETNYQPTIVSGMPFSTSALDSERKRITSQLMNSGYYRFNKDYITFSADSAAGSNAIDLTLHLSQYQANSSAPKTLHPRYKIRSVRYIDNEQLGNLRRRVLENNTAIQPGEYFSRANLQRTYNNFGRLPAVKYTSIRFSEDTDSLLLDCDIQVSLNKPSTIAFQPEGTNTAGDLGAAASLTYENRNLFGGAEQLSVRLRAAFEAITGLEGYQNEDYEEYSAEAKLSFPQILAPFLSRNFIRKSKATSELSIAYDLQNRPEFHRRVFSTAWRYRWSSQRHQTSYRFDLLDLNYVHMPWISSTFKHDYLDSVSNRNAILRYNYEDLFIMKIGFGMSYNQGGHAFRANIETSGNLLSAVAHAARFHKNERDQYTLFNIAFAQYAKFDFDYTHLWTLDEHNQLVAHANFGIACPYGNSSILPFEKRYFAGGANSVRGWSVRSLGPGSFKGTDGRIDFINQTGDMKLDLNLEYRTFLFWKLNGAAFIDAGNIWTLRNYADQPGGQFRFSQFYKQVAVAYGLGFRLNFDYFVMRIDLGIKAIDPAYDNSHEHYPILHPRLRRDFSFHFAVGLPF